MWVRSQDNQLVNLDRITFVDTANKLVYANWDVDTHYRKLGEYATEERCIEVINEIQNALIENNTKMYEYYGDRIEYTYPHKHVYIMPEV